MSATPLKAGPVIIDIDDIDPPRRPAWWMLAAAALIALVVLAQGITAPFQKDAEAQSAQWTQSVADGHLMAPSDYYGRLIEKPLLYYWLSAAAARLAGGKTDEVNARIVPLLAGTALALEVLVWTAANVGEAQGWLAFLFLIATYGYSSRATLALTDMLMTFLIVTTLLILYPQVEGAASRPRTIAAICVVQLAVLTKGPVTMVLVGMAVFVYFVLTRRNPFAILREGWIWVFAGAVTVLTAGWYWLWAAFGSSRILPIFLAQNFGHFLPANYGGTGEAARPIWYITARLIGGAMPIVLLIPAAIVGFLTGEIGAARRRPLAFQASLAIAVIALFSIASAKRDDYILPALPGVAILCASVFVLEEPASARARWARILRGAAVCAIALAMIAAVGAGVWLAISHARVGLHLQSSDADQVALYAQGFATMRMGYLLYAIVVAGGAVAAFFAITRRRAILAGAAAGILTLAGSMLVNAIVRPTLAWERSAKSFAFVVKEQVGAAPVFVVREPNYDFSFYYGTEAPPLMGRHREPPPPGTPSYLVADDAELRSLAPQYRARLTLVVRSHLISHDGPLALYAIAPEATR